MPRPHRSKPILQTTLAFAFALALIAPATSMAARRHAPREGLLAYRILNARSGGLLKTRDGAALFVPRSTLRSGALVTITRFKGGMYDFNISTSWQGRVRVTLPRSSRPNYIMHQVGGVWMREGARGKRTVWVGELSVFSWLGDKIKAVACLSWDPAAVVQCWIKKGLTKVEGDMETWLLGRALSPCQAHIIASSGKGLAGILSAIIASQNWCVRCPSCAWGLPTR